MTLSERALYHQIHPAKLAVDWASGILSAVLLWQHRLVAGLLWGLMPPVLVSAPFLVGAFDATLDRYRRTAVGRHVALHMTRAMTGLRLLGMVGVWLGAWYRRVSVIAIGLGVVLAAWARGWAWHGTSFAPPHADTGRAGLAGSFCSKLGSRWARRTKPGR